MGMHKNTSRYVEHLHIKLPLKQETNTQNIMVSERNFRVQLKQRASYLQDYSPEYFANRNGHEHFM